MVKQERNECPRQRLRERVEVHSRMIPPDGGSGLNSREREKGQLSEGVEGRSSNLPSIYSTVPR